MIISFINLTFFLTITLLSLNGYGLIISKSKIRDKSSTVELYEDISPYNQNIPANMGAISVILSVSNDFKINFYEWLKFLISYN